MVRGDVRHRAWRLWLERHFEPRARFGPQLYRAPATGAAFVVRRELASEGISGIEPSASDLEPEFAARLEKCRRWQQIDLDRDDLTRGEGPGDIVARTIGARNMVGNAPDAVREEGAAESVCVLELNRPAIAHFVHAHEQAGITTPSETEGEV